MNLEQYIEALEGNNQISIYELDFNINRIFEGLHMEISREEDDKVRGKIKTEIETIGSLQKGTALHLAVAHNRPDIVKKLIQHGADLDIQCDVSKRTTENNLKKVKGHWVPADYAGKHVVRTSHPSFTALELAEYLENDCQESFNTVEQTPAVQAAQASSQSNWSPSFHSVSSPKNEHKDSELKKEEKISPSPK
jgi:hypothetical protein